MFTCLIALYLVVFFASAVKASAREGYWSPVTIFGISAFYYYLSVPLELYLRGEEIFAVYPSVCGIAAQTRTAIGILALLALVGFVVGHGMSGLGPLISQSNNLRTIHVPKSLGYLALSILVLLLLIYRLTIFDRLGYAEGNIRRYEDPVFSYLTRMCLLFGCLVSGIIVQRRGWLKLPAFFIAALACGWGLYTSDKDPLLKAALALSVFLIGRTSRSMRHLYFYCGAAVMAVAALPVFSAYRADAPIDIRRAATEFSVQETDAKGPMISLVAALDTDRDKFYGRSYLLALAAWVPKLLWPDRPYDLAQEFAFEEIPNWQPGMGLGYSLLAEAYLNFGYAGAFFQYLAIGYGLGRIWRALYTPFAARGALAYWRATLAVTYFAMLIIMHRVSTSYLPQTCMFELFIPVAVLCFADARLNSAISSSHRSRRVAPVRRSATASSVRV
jgi:hypothetical protein